MLDSVRSVTTVYYDAEQGWTPNVSLSREDQEKYENQHTDKEINELDSSRRSVISQTKTEPRSPSSFVIDSQNNTDIQQLSISSHISLQHRRKRICIYGLIALIIIAIIIALAVTLILILGHHK